MKTETSILFTFLALGSIAVELIVAYLMGFRKKKEFLTSFLASVITKPTFCLFFYAVSLDVLPIKGSISLIVFVFMEILMIVIEWKLFLYALEDRPSKELFFLSLRVNLYVLLAWPFIAIIVNSFQLGPQLSHSHPIVKMRTLISELFISNNLKWKLKSVAARP